MPTGNINRPIFITCKDDDSSDNEEKENNDKRKTWKGKVTK